MLELSLNTPVANSSISMVGGVGVTVREWARNQQSGKRKDHNILLSRLGSQTLSPYRTDTSVRAGAARQPSRNQQEGRGGHEQHDQLYANQTLVLAMYSCVVLFLKIR